VVQQVIRQSAGRVREEYGRGGLISAPFQR
jgi:hypothetical protein